MFRVGLDGPGVEIREPVEIRAIPVAVSADACILSGEVRSLGQPEKAGPETCLRRESGDLLYR